ncbi:endonuclease/exonuclease/phosphatase family protein [Streptomyces flaveus]|uniref:endonuclease/exonuclease/phosphatase family protein n=1 Tax=Streptomyces flaveus TaxID=66370 RepID=UPI00331BE8FE
MLEFVSRVCRNQLSGKGRARSAAVMVMAATLAGVGLAATPASASPGPTEFQVGTFNMGGGAEEGQDSRDEDDPFAAVSALQASVEDRDPAFITVQEACEDWMNELDARLGGYTIAFDPVTGSSGDTANCKNSDGEDVAPFGNAVIYRDDLGIDAAQTQAYSLQTPGDRENREMLCVHTATTDGLAVCSVHLTPGGGDDADAREREARVATQHLEYKQSQGYTVFAGGDLNGTPSSDALDQFYDAGYARGAEGAFKEVDSPCGNTIASGYWVWPGFYAPCRAGESTQGISKIDFMFVDPSVTVRSADATSAEYSDHDPLWADVTL